MPPKEGRPPVLFLHMHKAGGSSMCRMATGRLYARERLEGHLNCNTAGDSPCRWDEESATLPVAAGAGFGAACSLRLQVMRQGGRDGAGLRGQGAAATGPWTFAGIERFYSDVVDPKSGRLCPGFLYLLLLREPVARIVSHLKFETFSLASVRRWMRPVDGPPGDNPAQLERDTKVSCGRQMVDAVNVQGIRHKHPLGSIITGSPIVDNFYTRCVVLSRVLWDESPDARVPANRSLAGEAAYLLGVGELTLAHYRVALEALRRIHVVLTLPDLNRPEGLRLLNGALGWSYRVSVRARGPDAPPRRRLTGGAPGRADDGREAPGGVDAVRGDQGGRGRAGGGVGGAAGRQPAGPRALLRRPAPLRPRAGALPQRRLKPERERFFLLSRARRPAGRE